MTKFKIGDQVHAKPNLPYLTQNILNIEAIGSTKKYYLRDLINNKSYIFAEDIIYSFFEKTYCHVPANHPYTNIFK
jgi:hypothetical protein